VAAADKSLFLRILNFIDEKIEINHVWLDGVEQDVESFKKNNKLTDINQTKSFLEGSSEYDRKEGNWVQAECNFLCWVLKKSSALIYCL
jgi:hypothetical protein